MTIVPYPHLTLPASFYQLLGSYLSQRVEDIEDSETEMLTLHFRDPDYSAEDGGFHPVEIGLEREGKDWQLCYLTDFAWSGGPFPELEKEIDFCFSDDRLYHCFIGSCHLTQANELLQTYLQNFISYVQNEVFKVELKLH
ncbi:DUF2787 family protein [Shewanella algae]|uniref:DUF2787 family protein n=1 Tax=Shewanella algae TaxID=38313 RepID=UPI001C574A03|nr:DUF2787 family protein [Shewanella algae]